MSVFDFIAKLDEKLAHLAKDAPPQEAANVSQVITDAYDRLGAILTRVRESGGLLPDGMGSELIMLAGMLMSLANPSAAPPGVPPVGPAMAATPAGVPAAAPGTVHVAQPGTVPLVLTGKIGKQELDPFTFRKVTMSAAQDRMWCAMRMFDEKNDPGALNELKGIIAMLTNVSNQSGTPSAGEATKCVAMTPEKFGVYSAQQMKAATTDDRETAAKRLQHLAKQLKVAKAFFFEGGADPPPSGNPLVARFEVLTAFAPDKGTALDLTTKGDQSDQDADIMAWAKATNNPGSTSFTKGAVEKVGAVIDDLMKELGLPTGEQQTAEGGETATPEKEKTDEVAKAASFSWPRDMTTTIEKPEKPSTRAATAKRSPEDLSWGSDPKGLRG